MSDVVFGDAHEFRSLQRLKRFSALNTRSR